MDDNLLVGNAREVKLGSIAVGGNQPCLLIPGNCTVDSNTPRHIKELANLGFKAIRGGVFKPRSRAGSYIGPREEGLRILFAAAKDNNIEVVFTEVGDTYHVGVVDEMVEKVGFKGEVVLWIGARTANQELMLQLGQQNKYPVMVKNSLIDKTVDEWLNRASWLALGEQKWGIDGKQTPINSPKSGNERILLCVRGGENNDSASRLRGIPNLHWIGDAKKRFWPPVGVDTNHFTGTMEDDLVLKYLQAALDLESPNFVLLETKLDNTTSLIDDKQAVLISRLPEVISMIEKNNKIRALK